MVCRVGLALLSEIAAGVVLYSVAKTQYGTSLTSDLNLVMGWTMPRRTRLQTLSVRAFDSLGLTFRDLPSRQDISQYSAEFVERAVTTLIPAPQREDV